jgi:hypothetical protein
MAAVVLALAAAAVLAGPTLGAQAPWTGSSAECRYTTKPSGERVLTKIVVHPPDLYAQTESGTQMVGWRFVVRRSKNWDTGPWTITYRSPIQKAVATTDQKGDFSPMKVAVQVPNTDDLSAIRYHVTLKMLFFDTDGSVSERFSHRFDSIKWTEHGANRGQGDYCPASLDTGP